MNPQLNVTAATICFIISFIALVYCSIDLIPWVMGVFVFSASLGFCFWMSYRWELHKEEIKYKEMKIENTFYLVKEKNGARYLKNDSGLKNHNELSPGDLHTNFQVAKEYARFDLANDYKDKANKAKLLSDEERPVFQVVKKTVEIELSAI